ncbi:MAG: flagellar type III secretion system pore protein FliP, partial [Pseudomonadota bacterium]
MSPTCSDDSARRRDGADPPRPRRAGARSLTGGVRAFCLLALIAVMLLPEPAAGQSVTIDLGPLLGEGDASGDAAPTAADGADAEAAERRTGAGTAQAERAQADGSLAARILQLFALITVLSLAPGIAVMVTCFPFMITVLAILRQGLGLQASPPNMMLVSLALFLSYFVMEPVLTEVWTEALDPLIAGRIDIAAAFERGMPPLRAFMEGRTDPATVAELAAAAPAGAPLPPGSETPLGLLVPAFMLSELSRAFTVGFMLFLPFVIIDLVVASILMSMGMMMVPPVVVSLPLKL